MEIEISRKKLHPQVRHQKSNLEDAVLNISH